jgi:transposase
MLIVETIAKIRRLYHVEGKGYKTIAKALNLSKNTVKKVLRSEQTSFSYNRQTLHRRVLGDYSECLSTWLDEDRLAPKCRRRTAKKLYEALQAEGFNGSYEAVNYFVRQYREQKKNTLPQVYIPLQFAPGEAFQFDWSEEEIELAGELTRIKVAHIRLCHSRYFLMVAYPNEQLEMLLDAHDKAFAFFGGTCLQGTYDNMKTAVKQIFVGKAREFNPRFLQMTSHYCFEPVACTPAAGWEKGQVENQVATGRENFFTPLQRVKTLAELNDKLKAQCLAWAKSQSHPELKDKTVWEVYEEERSALIPYEQAFGGYQVQKAVVSPSSMVRVDTNDYSVDCHYVGKVVEIRLYAPTIIVTYQQHEIARHDRCFKRYQRQYNP